MHWSMRQENSGHAAAFAAEGRKIGVHVPNNVERKTLEAASRSHSCAA